MRLTTKLLKKMIRQELKESNMGHLGRHLGASFDAEAWRKTDEYKIAEEEAFEQYDSGFFDGLESDDLKSAMSDAFNEIDQIDTEEKLQTIVSDILGEE